VPDNLTLLQADATSLPFENNSFDVLLTVHVLQVIPDRLKTLSENPSAEALWLLHWIMPWTPEEFERQWRAYSTPTRICDENNKPLAGQRK